jgi:hypothetical protein
MIDYEKETIAQRDERDRKFLQKLQNDPRYETINGKLVFKLEETISTIKSNIHFFSNDFSPLTPENKNNYLKHGYITLFNAMTKKIKRDHCE